MSTEQTTSENRFKSEAWTQIGVRRVTVNCAVAPGVTRSSPPSPPPFAPRSNKLLPISVLGWMLICSACHVHDCRHLSCGTCSVLTHVTVSFWPHTVPISASYSALSSVRVPQVLFFETFLSLTQTPRSHRGCETYHQHCPSCHGLNLPVHDGHCELPLSVLP